MTQVDGDLYVPAPGVALRVTGARQARAHFAVEYGAPPETEHTLQPDLLVDVRFAHRSPAGMVTARHKTVRWAVEARAHPGAPLSCRIVLSGAPRRFALSLIQGFVVEPLASLAAARAGAVLLPAAALAQGGGALVLLGRSRSGKTSLVARAAAAGHPALADDQVLIDEAGDVTPWPRRLRVYPDLRETAPEAAAALPLGKRVALSGLAALRVASRGWVAPSLPLSWDDLRATPTRGSLRAQRLIVLERGGTPDLTVRPLPAAAVLTTAAQVLREQRLRLRTVLGATGDAVLAAAERAEAETLSRALQGVPAEHWSVPTVWPAGRAVAALAERLAVA
jgi:hypothetical protein